jgi:hypothetical protein
LISNESGVVQDMSLKTGDAGAEVSQ